jgi:predicted transcriptional regulator
VQYRSREDIVAAILDIAKHSTLKTRIMYGAFLSYPQLKEYLYLLLENDLLEHDANEKVYSTTPRGMQFLDMYKKMDNMYKKMDNMYKKMDNMVPQSNMLTRTVEA